MAKITFKQSIKQDLKVPFKNLFVGDTFYSSHRNPQMKIGEFHDPMEGSVNAISLLTGDSFFYNPDDVVYHKNYTLTEDD